MGWLVMNNSNTGTLNISRLIQEAEALLLGEKRTQTKSCTNCGDCKAQSCADKKTKHTIRQPLTTGAAR